MDELFKKLNAKNKDYYKSLSALEVLKNTPLVLMHINIQKKLKEILFYIFMVYFKICLFQLMRFMIYAA